MIEIKNLHKTYGNNPILQGIDLTIKDGDIFGLVGVSGAGKSTLLRCINGLEDYDAGTLIVNDTDIKKLNKEELRHFRSKIGMIFQQFSLLERKTVYENINFPMMCFNYPKIEANKKILELLELVELSDKINCLPRELSGGQKQRVAIARALTLSPKILLCDEATSALDPNITQSILTLLKKINVELGLTIVVVTHQMSVVKEICSEIAILSKGKLTFTGNVQNAFLNHHNVLDELLGESIYQETSPEKTNIILVQRNPVDSNILSRIALKTGVEFETVWGGLDKYGESVAGSFTISVSNEESTLIEEYLTQQQIEWRKA